MPARRETSLHKSHARATVMSLREVARAGEAASGGTGAPPVPHRGAAREDMSGRPRPAPPPLKIRRHVQKTMAACGNLAVAGEATVIRPGHPPYARLVTCANT